MFKTTLSLLLTEAVDTNARTRSFKSVELLARVY